MSSINNVQLKSIKMSIGHDQGGFEANIFFKNKKIGRAEDDGWGGGMEVTIFDQQEAFEQAAQKFHSETNENILDPSEAIIEELLRLSDLEKAYKKSEKDGYSVLIYLDYRPRKENGEFKFDVPVPHPNRETIVCVSEELVPGVLESKKPVTYEIYRSLSDFIKWRSFSF